MTRASAGLVFFALLGAGCLTERIGAANGPCNSARQCERGLECHPTSSLCVSPDKIPICAPGRVYCDAGQSRTCTLDGLAFEAAIPCNDGLPCTLDECSEGAGCIHTVIAGLTETICDNALDDDCDGKADTEDADCACGSVSTMRSCGTNAGECKVGTQECGSDSRWGPCVGAIGPSSEACDGKDNDCDGVADNGGVCGGTGGSGGSGGAPGPCMPGASCNPGPTCKLGTLSCEGGRPICLESGTAPDGMACGENLVCRGGECVACAGGMSCAATNPCHEGVVSCSSGTPDCEDRGLPLPNGTACGEGMVCRAGACIACSTGTSCTPANVCRAGVISCETGSAVCTEGAARPNGQSCGTDLVCRDGSCGSCSAGASCTPTNVCHAGRTSCSTGSPICDDTGEMLVNGSACGANQVCSSGTCVPCTAGGACAAANPCHLGAVSCASGTPACADTGTNAADGTSCATNTVCRSGSCSEYLGSWVLTTTLGEPAARQSHSMIWTGSEMIVWGGNDASVTLANGARYRPQTDTWAALSTVDAPSYRKQHSAVWTGSEMIIWGGEGSGGSGYTNTGARYNPVLDSWTASTGMTGAPSGRSRHFAAFTGSEMVIWGGRTSGSFPNFTYTNTGGRYNPSTDTWTTTALSGAPAARWPQATVFTGSELITWGGETGNGTTNTGGRYNLATDRWLPTSTLNAPSARSGHGAVWTGSEMMVWGGSGAVGGRYNPTTDEWAALPAERAPELRSEATLLWTGTEMIVWAGNVTTQVLASGGRYDPATGLWSQMNASGSPAGRVYHAAVWTGREMIVWGGSSLGGGTAPIASGGRYQAAE